MTVSSLVLCAGLVLILSDRITELTIPGVGTIRTVTEQAIIDAKTVADIKDQVSSIKTRVENGSATVDLVASEATKAKEMSELVAAQSKEASQKLETLNAALREANGALDKLKANNDFQSLILAAQNDDRLSFDKLSAIAEDKSNQFNNLAARAWETIFDAHSGPMSLSGFTMPWAPGIDPSKLTFHDLTEVFKSIPAGMKPALLEYIWHRTDISELSRLDFMMNVMKTDSSLTAVEYAGRYFTEGTGQKIKAMALAVLAPWWDEHRKEFLDK